MLLARALSADCEAHAEHAVQLCLRQEDLTARAHTGVEHAVEVVQRVGGERDRQREGSGVRYDAEDGEREGGRRDEREGGGSLHHRGEVLVQFNALVHLSISARRNMKMGDSIRTRRMYAWKPFTP